MIRNKNCIIYVTLSALNFLFGINNLIAQEIPQVVKIENIENAFSFSLGKNDDEAFVTKSIEARINLSILQLGKSDKGWSEVYNSTFVNNELFKDADPFYSTKQSKIFFISNRDNNPHNFDIYYAVYKNGVFQSPVKMPVVNSDSIEAFPSIADNGNIYFASNRKGSYGGTDIYVSRFINGKYQTPTNLGITINGQGREETPFISSDESFIIFSSNKQAGFGNSDLYISFWINSSWTKPQNLGSNINSNFKEFSPFYRNRKLYFTRRIDTLGSVIENVYSINFNPEKYRNLVKYLPIEFAPGIISTGNGFSTAFDKNGKRVYFIKSSDEYKQVQKLFFSEFKNGMWSIPIMDSISEISNFISTPFITKDGTKMLLAANLNKMDLYISYKQNHKWSVPQKLPGSVNTNEYHEYFGTLSKNNTLYFASDKGLGGGDIFYAKFVNGKWVQPTPIVELNTELAESNPLIAPDESFLVFMAKRPEGFGDYDLYISYNENGKWSKPFNLGPNINTGVKDFQPCFSPDGKYLFFSRVPWPSGTPAMYGNEYIYYIDINVLRKIDN